MNIVIVEDEIVAAQTLSRLIQEIRTDFTILTVLQSVEDSVEWFSQHPMPDLIFMDIHLADGSSFEIFNHVKIDCPIIFTTAYNEYALDAFEVNSIDYLLKPINKKRLTQAILKFGNFTYKKDNTQLINDFISTINKSQNRYKTHFLIPHKDKLIPLAVEDIACFYSELKIARVVCFNSQSYSLDYSLEELMKHLNPELFFRVNRQYIVAHKAINDISIWFAGKLSVNLNVNVPERILVSKARATEFKSWYTREN
ncbi:LytTR family DNA-binding domain-containing protein [Bacteroides sp. 519]|uniref:LytR/AlgR family response regulator transcription factor n=1 Tax=Bacteroides sp. 519 TaxID=2302937 RepID=UPI0013CF8448|nr:LytTR family DNA-binding domain-containing protein [Bacteroides sp. 519]NDV56572.1 DNA-binding response regulator [Bacteroides sp. 519]